MSSSRHALGLVAAGAITLAAPLARAQCTMDTDCKGDRVCEGGRCVSPVVPPTPTPAPAAEAPAAPPREPPVPASPAAPRPTIEPPVEPHPRLQRHSQGMMVGGIVLVSLAPVGLLVAGVAGFAKVLCGIDQPQTSAQCQSYNSTVYGSLAGTLVLVAVGVPLLVIGATKEPVTDGGANASLAPWATPTSVGLGLRIDL